MIHYCFDFLFNTIGVEYRYISDYSNLRKREIFFLYSTIKPTTRELENLDENRIIFYVPAERFLLKREDMDEDLIKAKMRSMKLHREFKILASNVVQEPINLRKINDLYFGYFNFDLIGNLIFFLNEYEYKKSKTEFKDKHGNVIEDFIRFNDSLDYPFINAIVWLVDKFLSEAVTQNKNFLIKKNFWPNNEKSAVALSHNVEKLQKWTFFSLIQSFFKDIKFFVTFKWNFMFRRLLGKIKYILTNDEPYWNFFMINDIEEQNNIKSTYFIGSEKENKYDVDYFLNEDDDLKSELNELKAKNHEIALLGSYRSYKNFILKRQKELVRDSLGVDTVGIRQLRYRYDYDFTAEQHEKENFIYDSSKSIKNGNGFRNGLAIPYYMFAENIDGKQQFDFLELPLTIHENFFYKNKDIYINFDEAKKKFKKILNNMISTNGFLGINLPIHLFYDIPYLQKFYIFIIEYMKKKNIYLDSYKNMAKWWKLREKIIIKEFNDQIHIKFNSQMKKCSFELIGKVTITKIRGLDATFKNNKIYFKNIKRNSRAIIEIDSELNRLPKEKHNVFSKEKNSNNNQCPSY